jgi:hypothetical protein
VVDDEGEPLAAPVSCGLCGHPWSAHLGGGPTAVWVTCCASPDGAGLADDGEEPEGVGAGAADGGLLPPVAGLAGPATGCYCRRSVDEFRAEAVALSGQVASGGAVAVWCVTCGATPAEDTQCRTCRRERQRAARERFAARQARVARDARRRGR